MDPLSPEKRSEVMSKIRSTGNAPELALQQIVKSALSRRKIHLNSNLVPGSPDIYIPSLKLALFVHGCFWHSCRTHGTRPHSNVEYWSTKLESNSARDVRVQRTLRRLGIGVWVVWEHDLRARNIESTRERIARRLEYRADNGRTER